MSKHVSPGELEGVQLNVVDYSGIRYCTITHVHFCSIISFLSQ